MDVAKKSPPWNERLLALIFLVCECFRLGVAYTPLSGAPDKLPEALAMITAPLPGPTDNWHPIWVFGVAWLLNGFVALFAFRRPALHNTVYVAAIVGLSYWAVAYFIAQFRTDDHRSWFTASGYLIFAFATFIIGHRTRPQKPKATT